MGGSPTRGTNASVRSNPGSRTTWVSLVPGDRVTMSPPTDSSPPGAGVRPGYTLGTDVSWTTAGKGVVLIGTAPSSSKSKRVDDCWRSQGRCGCSSHKHVRIQDRGFTLKADSVIARVWVRISGLVWEEVNSSHSQKPSSTLRPGDVDWVTNTPVPQPAGVTHVHASLPRQVQLPGGCQPRTELGALILCFVEGKFLNRRGVEDSAWEREDSDDVDQEANTAVLEGVAYLTSSQRSSRRRRSRSRLSRRRFSHQGSSPCHQSKAPVAPGWDTLKGTFKVTREELSQPLTREEDETRGGGHMVVYLTVWSESHPASHWWYPSS